MGPGALPPARCPSEKPLSVPRRAWFESRGRRNPRIARSTQIPTTAAINTIPLLLIGMFEISALASALAIEAGPTNAEVEVAAASKQVPTRVAGKDVGA